LSADAGGAMMAQPGNGMKIGVVSDIHCNAAGLKAALQRLDAADEILCLGDSILEFRFSNEVAAILRERNAVTIHGNHEEVFYGPQGARARAAEGVDDELADWLGAQPRQRRLMRAGKSLHMVHSTPWEPRGDYVFPGSPDFARMGESGADILLYGHTHRAVAQRVGATLVVNPGSAGEARGHGPDATLSCALIDLPSGAVEIIRFTAP
jgi:putative phosphoesterase